MNDLEGVHFKDKEVRHIIRFLASRDPVGGKRWINIPKDEDFYNMLANDRVLYNRSKRLFTSFVVNVHKIKTTDKKTCNNTLWMERLKTL